VSGTFIRESLLLSIKIMIETSPEESEDDKKYNCEANNGFIIKRDTSLGLSNAYLKG